MIPVNTGIAGQTLLGERAYASLRDIPEPVDLVDVTAIDAKVPWMPP